MSALRQKDRNTRWPCLATASGISIRQGKTDRRMDGRMDTVSLASFPVIIISLVLLRCSIADAAALLTSVTPKQSRQTSLQWSLQLRYSSPWSSFPWWCQTSAVASESHTDNLDHSGVDSLSLLSLCAWLLCAFLDLVQRYFRFG